MRSVIVTAAGVIGILCTMWWIVAELAGLSLVVVTTGSMTPTIPVGGVAVDHAVPAADLETGMIVTVPRAGSPLPVTHRIVDIDSVPGHPEGRSLTLRGDANDSDDPAPYPVTSARVVLAHAPALGYLLTALTTPPAQGLTIATTGLLIVWSFWPAPRSGSAPRSVPPSAHADQPDLGPTPDAP